MAVVSRHNPSRNSTITKGTPMQVGNGGFAYGMDITGMQSFQPFGILSEWGWKNDSLPDNETLAEYHGVNISTHGKMIPYATYDDSLPLISNWLYSNPGRINLGRIGLNLNDSGAISEEDLMDSLQVLDLWTGVVTSNFSISGVKNSEVTVLTACDPDEDTVAFVISSPLITSGQANLGVFLDFPYNSVGEATQNPYVGDWSPSLTSLHETYMKTISATEFVIEHIIGNTTYFVFVACSCECAAVRNNPGTSHRYQVSFSPDPSNNSVSISARFSQDIRDIIAAPAEEVLKRSAVSWQQFWSNAGFIDLSGSSDPRWFELERRVILSRYLLAVNEAGNYPPQESGLVNINGWFGKFHMEMFFWHMAHWSLWGNQEILSKSTTIYNRFMQVALNTAKDQQTLGARWPKMTDPSGHPSPEIINSLLVWQQPHPMVFAEYEYRTYPTRATLEKWEDVIQVTADFMASWAWYNSSSNHYDLGPPMYPVSENTNYALTRNTAFELSYFRIGLGLAIQWMTRLGKTVPSAWTLVLNNLAPLPTYNGTYVIYEGIGDMWNNLQYTSDHPSMAGIYGWLSPTDVLDMEIFNKTIETIYQKWQLSSCWGWDFPLLAMTAARSGDPDMAVNWLLHPLFQFDDIGMPMAGGGGLTPYFPSSGGLLYAIAFMTAGWDGGPDTHAPGFGSNWTIAYENLLPAL
eukprot:Phypoly_transcript_04154.p1 GENE.Phypoly_transcript_04154~~Phypoly_transcript_04154.p1  ORF type:complete len:701 (+),score=64.66 Phypoly_transcript_04154:35-2104(+)